MGDLLDEKTRGGPDNSCSLRIPSVWNPRSPSDCHSWILAGGTLTLSKGSLEEGGVNCWVAGEGLLERRHLSWVLKIDRRLSMEGIICLKII